MADLEQRVQSLQQSLYQGWRVRRYLQARTVLQEREQWWTAVSSFGVGATVVAIVAHYNVSWGSSLAAGACLVAALATLAFAYWGDAGLQERTADAAPIKRPRGVAPDLAKNARVRQTKLGA